MSLTKKLILIYLIFNINLVNATEQERKIGFNFFDKIYCINLPKSTERKMHMLQEFARLGVTNFTLFSAISQDSAEVAYIMQSEFVKNYPPCFRCKKNFCKCHNNVLLKPQIGNWLSMIKIFKDIIKNDFKYVLIVEDDLEFTADANQIFAQIFNDEYFVQKKINTAQPLLVRCERKTNRKYCMEKSKPSLVNSYYLSNACFMVNIAFAKSFLKNLAQIDTASDIFIHLNMVEFEANLQNFAVSPSPSYQLSYSEQPKFYSTITPHGKMDELDAHRKKKIKVRKEYWEHLWQRIIARF